MHHLFTLGSLIGFSLSLFAQGPCDHLKTFECHGAPDFCAEIVPFDPTQGLGYWNYPLNGETKNNQYRSYIRRDLKKLIQYATAHTFCKSQTWEIGNKKPLGLGDMSEVDGSIPGTSIGRPGHPEGTHIDGYDLDIAYYQTGTPNNFLRPVCAHKVNQKDKYHCTKPPHLLDIKRTALFIGTLHDSPRLRVIGVDGKIGPLLHNALDSLCQEGVLNNRACQKPNRRIAYEETDTKRGWFRFHHHHLHVSQSSDFANHLNMKPVDIDKIEKADPLVHMH